MALGAIWEVNGDLLYQSPPIYLPEAQDKQSRFGMWWKNLVQDEMFSHGC